VDNEGKENVKNGVKLLALEMTIHRMLTPHDLYHRNCKIRREGLRLAWPIVLDAVDIMPEPNLMLRYAKIIGLDPAKLKFSWSPKNKEEMDKMWTAGRRMLSTIPNSTRIVEEKTSKGLVLDDEVRKWKVEFWKGGGRQY
jgi:hypothetical protein